MHIAGPPWVSSEWATTDDRVRGGSSISHLTPSPDARTASFHGHLDTSTLGGAGFASQRTAGIRHWVLSSFAGILIKYEGVREEKYRWRYVIALKDEIPGRREDGREMSGVSWEAEFVPDLGDGEKWLDWTSFRPTYRGRDKDDCKPLDLGDVKRVAIMMRSFFDEQHGDFALVLHSIEALEHAPADGSVDNDGARVNKSIKDDDESLDGTYKDIAPVRRRSWWRRLFCRLV